ncbi:helicase-exonuclease AddAB subunit AddA [Blautia hansenii]|uniref:ATP-dependent helicase/nuclease subunit A n=1 Tax=Blautia hansenii DSM 20583 TaxID=537007 RepID=C9LAG5_BLAHA|nr:helicase-exonuclease AddAB subunit AddA [Blautia hansenii]ASM70330.1 helicase-exonuclease AddAB subunit AddA [Blautia hansenii DSM 20583]EEX20963.1 ATP-dependent nuclease subunit A [Blautia hansenii DSM 20583]UWO10179.1 helicase-exonuclease AddAB subunit AddA [Blautia hansenii DSM 20583]
MGVSWTEEQQKVIDTRNCNILVSAAAGSGKTAVLVERIIQRITDKNNPVDIDELLIVTFTRAAAGEMKERIRQAIEKKLEANPEDEHLQRQSTLVHHALITTIDSFCSYIVKNYFHLIDLDPSFRMGDEGEMRLLQADVADAVLEEAYTEEAPSFLAFSDGFAGGKTDKKIPEMIIKLYSFSMSYPYPEEWLLNCRKAYEVKTLEELENAEWMKLIKNEVKQEIKEASMLLKQALEISKEPDGPVFYIGLLEDEVSELEKLERTENFFEWKEMLDKLEFKRLPAGKKAEKELVSESRQELAKNLRNEAKEQIKALKERYFQETAEEMLENLQRAGEPVGVLVDLTLAFMKLYREKKKEKNILDFGDLEHYALEILIHHTKEKDERTDAARELSKKFAEIMIDEYQDSNLVQEKLLTSVSKIEDGIYNIFMVGDVKQSIYRFRLARPDLFMEKFKTYPQEAGENCLRIDLHKNFRSRAEVLEGVNYLFYQIMGEDLGGVEYDSTAALYPGRTFPPKQEEESEPATEVLLLEDEEENTRELEARMVALRIGELAGKYLVLDKKTEEYRPAKYSDFTILLRTMSGWAETFKKILNSCGIPASVTTKTGYFSAQEVTTVLDYLKILDNPMQDIPLAAALHGLPDGFSFQELAEIKVLGMENEKNGFYEALLLGEKLSSPLGEKIRRFFAVYRDLRRKVPYTPMHELIWDFYDATDFLVYQQSFVSGEQRKANLLMLAEKARDYESTSYRGLFNFIRYIENLKKYQVDFGEANTLSENEDTVRIMSIHGSKGLEFPIVFVCGMGKQINMQDARESIVLHPDLGIGSPYVDTQLRIRTRTILQKAVQREILLESLGEELRILYVALTRAKEKLILTGVTSKLEDTLKSFEMLKKQEEERLPYGLRVKGKSYLDWVLAALARHRAMKPLYEMYDFSVYSLNEMYDREPDFTVRQVQPLELVLDEAQLRTEEMLKKGELLLWDSSEVYDEKWRKLFRDSFSYEYPYQAEGAIPAKLTVSEIKRMQSADTEESEILLEKEETEEIVPLFMQETKEELKGAAKGTLYHRVWENLDYEKIDTKEQIEEQLENMLTTEEKKSIWISDFYRFAKNPLAVRMKAAAQRGQLYREQPFVIAMPANQMKKEYETEEEILVQGIIDAYFEEEDGLVLVDYKTDKVQKGQEKELIEKYKVQMRYYKKALEMITDREVKEIYIYSTGIGKAVLVHSAELKTL